MPRNSGSRRQHAKWKEKLWIQEARFILILTGNFKYCAYLVPVKTIQYLLGGCKLLLFDFKNNVVLFAFQNRNWHIYFCHSSFCLVWLWGVVFKSPRNNLNYELFIIWVWCHRPHSFVCLTSWGKRITGIGGRFYCKWDIFSFHEVKLIVCTNFYCVFDLLFCRWVCCGISCQNQQQWCSLCTETDVC